MRQARFRSFRARALAMVVGIFFLVALSFAQQAQSLSPPDLPTPAAPTSPPRAQPTVPTFLTIGVPQDPAWQQDHLATSCPGYSASDITYSDQGLTAVLTLNGRACNAYGTDKPALALTVSFQTPEQIRVKINDLEKQNFDLSERPDIYAGNIYKSSSAGDFKALYDFKFNHAPFEFWITRMSDGQVLFDTRGHKLVFEDQYLELTTNKLPDANLYGLGETIHSFRLGDNYTRTLFAADIGDTVDANLYGSHPFYMEHRYGGGKDGLGHSTHGVLLMTSNNMDVLIRPKFLQYRVVGGIIDLYVYTGPSPLAVTQQYVQSIGLPAMQSYWTLGFHQCRWGYTSTADTKEVVDKYREANIPLETIWNDIDYMQQYRDWTLDPNYVSQAAFVESLHKDGQHYVPIVDAAIYASNPTNRSEDSYYPYYEGLEQDVFLRNPDGTIYYGTVWPGYTAFPDWLAENTTEWWSQSMQNFSSTSTTFDGIWLDMNEVSSFCVGSCGTGRLQDNQVHPPFSLPGESRTLSSEGDVKNTLVDRLLPGAMQIESPTQAIVARAVDPNAGIDVNYPPYAIDNHQMNGDLANHAVAPNATHQDGTLEYNIHNLFGWGETVATYSALQKIRPGERPFIISRSTFPGAGSMAGHWGGDNYSKWMYLYYSIPHALTFQIFGIPMVGPDTCGFSGNTDEELCSRWMQLSAFLPFYRNHNTLNADPQEAYVWPSVANATRTAMNIRYSLLPYWYTLFKAAHDHGTPTIRPLMMEFPDDAAFAATDRQFLVGDAVMVIPVLEPGVEHTQGIFPGIAEGQVWYDWYTHKQMNVKAGENLTISAPLGHIPVYVRGGSVLPMQEPGYTTQESRGNSWDLLVALSDNGTASGSLYQDDGISEFPLEKTTVFFSVHSGVLSVHHSGTYAITQPLTRITVQGVATAPKSVSFREKILSSALWSYDTDRRLLRVSGLAVLTETGAFEGKSSGATSRGLDQHDQIAMNTVNSGWTLEWK